MKKLKYFISVLLVICSVAVFLAGCGKPTLAKPSGFYLDDDNYLNWDVVDYARSYLVEIVNVDSKESDTRTSRKTKISLYKLAEGDYEIKVKAISDGNRKDSAWSDPVPFHRDYETGCVYTLINNNTEYEITKAGSASGSLVLEDVYRGKPVTSIAADAFRGNARITDIVVGKNVTAIGNSAFYNCSKLTSITLPEALTSLGVAVFQSCGDLAKIEIPKKLTAIQPYTFAYCKSLTEIDIPEGIVSIGEKAFLNCTGLESVVIPDGVTELGGSAFEKCTALKTATIGGGITVISDGAFTSCNVLETVRFSGEGNLKEIGSKAFSDIGASEIELPEGLTSIASFAFFGAKNLDQVTIPSTVTSVGQSAFSSTKLYADAIAAGDSLIYADNWLVGVTAAAKQSLTALDATNLRAGTVGIAELAFSDSKELNRVTFPVGLKYIGDKAFVRSPKLWKIEIPDNSVVEIGSYAFSGCVVLRNIILGEGLKKIGSYAFNACEMLENIDDMPRSLTEMGSNPFIYTPLSEKADEYGVIYAGNWIVGYKEKAIAPSIVPIENLRGIADYAFQNCVTLRNITGAGISNARYIGRSAFSGCTSLSAISLNENITEIKDYTFFNCESLFMVSMPVSLEKVGRSAFYGCSRLSEVQFSGGELKEIGDYAFYGCSNVKSVNFGRRLEKIGFCAFYNCISIENITIPDSVTELGGRAFYACERLKTFSLGAGITEIPEYTFGKCTALESVVIPDTVTQIGRYAFFKCANIKSLSLGNGVERIGDYAFNGLSELKSLYLPKNVVSIGKFVFRGCNNLRSVVVTGDVKELDAYAFYGCGNLTIYTNVGSLPEGWSARWNASNRPIVWDSALSENDEWVVSVKLGENNPQNAKAKGGISDPLRQGYHFVGWAAEEGGAAVYTTAQLSEVEQGTTVYAVWAEGEPQEEPEDTESEPQA